MSNPSTFQIITAGVALYGAALATYNAWVSRRDKKVQIRVSCFPAVFLAGDGSAAELITIQSVNTGYVKVALSSAGLRVVTDKKYLFWPSPPLFGVKFPHELEPGRSVSVQYQSVDLYRGLANSGYTGEVELQAYVNTELGQEYLGAPFSVNIDALLRR